MRSCLKCGEKLVVNEDLHLMECISGKHVEPINTNLPQWWTNCYKADGGCGAKNVTTKKQQKRWQLKKGNKPIFDKDGKMLWEENPNQQPTVCHSCGRSFMAGKDPAA